MDRRGFLKLTGLVAAASALGTVPAAAVSASTIAPAESPRAVSVPSAFTVTRLAIREPGLYQVSGLVRIEAPVVEISGISNAQQISWSDAGSSEPRLASFVSFEQVDRPGQAPDVRVRGGRLESVSVVPVIFE